jgi:hypothetical protein
LHEIKTMLKINNKITIHKNSKSFILIKNISLITRINLNSKLQNYNYGFYQNN